MERVPISFFCRLINVPGMYLSELRQWSPDVFLTLRLPWLSETLFSFWIEALSSWKAPDLMLFLETYGSQSRRLPGENGVLCHIYNLFHEPCPTLGRLRLRLLFIDQMILASHGPLHRSFKTELWYVHPWKIVRKNGGEARGFGISSVRMLALFDGRCVFGQVTSVVKWDRGGVVELGKRSQLFVIWRSIYW